MADDSFNLGKSSGSTYIIGMIKWSSTKNTAGNYSSVKATLYVRKANDSTTLTVPTTGTWNYSLTINGSTISGSVYNSVLTGWVEVASHTVSKVNHNADGSKNVTISGSVTGPNSTSLAGKVTSGSKSVALDTIPRGSSVTVADTNIGSNPTINIDRASSGFTHTLTYAFGGLTGTIAEKTPDTKITTWTIPETFYARIPNSPSGECVITCITYSGTTPVGDPTTCVFKAIADKATCSPGVSVTAKVVNRESTALTGNNKTIIGGISNLQVVTAAEGKNSASITSISVYCGDNKQTGGDVTFYGADSAAVHVVVTDSRGYQTVVYDDSLSLIGYIAPTITPAVSREAPTANTVTVSVKGKWYNGSFGAVINSLKITVRRKATGDDDYHTMVEAPVTTNGNDYTATVELTGVDYTKAYSFLVRLDDAIYTDTKGYRDAKYATTSISKGIPIFDWGENDFQFNVPVGLPGGPLADYIIEETDTGEWYYRKWAQGLTEAWYHESLTPQPFTEKIADGLYSNDTHRSVTISIPEGLFNYAPLFTSINAYSNAVVQSHVGSASTTWLTYRLWSSYSTTPSNLAVQIYVAGRWKE